MNGKTHTIKLLVTGLALAAAMTTPIVALGASHPGRQAPAAHPYGAGTPWATLLLLDTAQQAQTVPSDGRSPDTRDAAQTAILQASATVDGRSPDTRDAAQAAGEMVAPTDGRSPDTIDAAVQAHIPVVTVIRSPGFEWSDFAIGFAAALVAVLLLRGAMILLGARRSRRKTSTAATA